MIAYLPFQQPHRDAVLIEQRLGAHLGTTYLKRGTRLHCDGQRMVITCLGLTPFDVPAVITFRKISPTTLRATTKVGPLTKVQEIPARYVR